MQVGDEIGPFEFQVSREQLVRYAGAAEDYNPIHYDDNAARGFGLPGVIVHGMLNMGLAARYVMAALPHGTTLQQYGVRFRQVVQPGEELLVSARVRDMSGLTVVLDVQLKRREDRPAVSGRMTVTLPKA